MSETNQRKQGNGSSSPSTDLHGDLERTRGLNRGGGDGEQRASVWRRSTDAVLGRSVDDQRHFNDAVLDLLDRWLRRLDEVAATGVRLESRVQELVAARDHLAGRLDDEVLRRREKDAGRERAASKETAALRAAQEGLAERLDGLGGRLDEAVARHDAAAGDANARARKQDNQVRTELEAFRGEVTRVLQGGENIRRSLIDAASRITALERHEAVLDDLPPRLERMDKSLSAEQRASSERTAALEQALAMQERLTARLDELQPRLGQVEEGLESGRRADAEHRAGEQDEMTSRARLEARLDELQARLDELEKSRVEAAGTDAPDILAPVQGELTSVGDRVARTEEETAGLRDLLRQLDEERQVDRVRLEALEATAEPVAAALVDATNEDDDGRAAASRADAAKMLARAKVASRGTVLQLGVSRGRFLEGCRELRLPARGVDPDPAVEEICRQSGLDLAVEHPLPYMEGLEAGSLGAVYSARIVETLPPAHLPRLLAEAHRVLAPGGSLILDTLNPSSLSALAGFYRDPARGRPVHAETAAFLMEAAGFEGVVAKDIDPAPDEVKLPDVPPGPWIAPGLEPLRARMNRQVDALNGLLFGYRGRRIVGVRP